MKTILSILLCLGMLLPIFSTAQEPVMAKMFEFAAPDTLEFSNNNHFHLAAVQDGADIVVLDGFYDPISESNTEENGGFQLLRLRKGSNGKLTVVAKSEQLEFLNKYGTTVSSFQKTENGFLAVNPQGVGLFDNDLKLVSKLYLNGYVWIGGKVLKGSTEVAGLFYDTKNKTVGLNIWNYNTRKFVHYDMVVISYCDEKDWVEISSQSSGIHELPNGNLLITLNLGHNTDNQLFASIDMEAFRNDPESDFINWSNGYKNRIANISIRPDGKMDFLIQYDHSEDEDAYILAKITANAQANTKDEFRASISEVSSKVAADGYRSMGYAQMLPDGRAIGIGMGKKAFHFHRELAIALYDAQMKPVRQYRLPTTMIAPEGKYYEVPILESCNYSRFFLNPSNSTGPKFYRANWRNTPDLLSNPETFYSAHTGSYAIWATLPGATKDEVILMTRNAFIKVNFTKFTPYTLPYTPDTGPDLTEYSPSTSTSSGTSSGSSSGTSSGSSTSKPTTPAKPTFITVINDLPAGDQPKGYIKLNYDGASTHTVYRGKEFQVECSRVKKVYKGSDSGTAKGDLLFEVEDNCGKTIKLSSVW